MSLANYSDQNIVDKCIQQNCLLNIICYASVRGTSIQSHLTFEAQDPNSELEPITIVGVKLFGIFSTQSEVVDEENIDWGVYVNEKQLQIEEFNIEILENHIHVKFENVFVHHRDIISIENTLA